MPSKNSPYKTPCPDRESYGTEEAAKKAAEKKGYRYVSPKKCNVCKEWHLQ